MNQAVDGPAWRPGWRWWLALALLIIVVHEAHELAHTVTGRVLCGTWASRDFNSWNIAGCERWEPTAAGPLLSYGLMWFGLLLERGQSTRLRWMAVPLIFAANPLARMLTVAMGGGDEWVLAREMLGSAISPGGLRIATLAVVSLLVVPPLRAAWRDMGGWAHRPGMFVLLSVAGMLVSGVVLFQVFNRLVRAGWLAVPIAGAPMLVHLVTATAISALAWLLWASWRTGRDAPP